MPYSDPEKAREAKKKYEEKREKRYTTWLFIFYPDSAPEDWEAQLSEAQVRIWVSPVHDRDVWTEADQKRNSGHVAGKAKKPHRHGIIQFDHAKTMAEAKAVISVLNGPENIKRCEDLSASVRYLIHKDDLQKAQYDRKDVLCFGGADPDALDSIGNAERYAELRRMREFIRKRGILDFYLFYDYCDQCESRWARLLDDCCTYPIEKYIASRRAASKDGRGDLSVDDLVRVDSDTGEVVV